MLRYVLKHESGTFGVTDLLVLVLIADAAQNAMSGDYQSVPGRSPGLCRLVREGRPLWGNLRKELVTMQELESVSFASRAWRTSGR